MGQRFGAYEIEEEVGRGGMGVVYRARELALERLVALKVIAEEIAAVPVLRVRFERESRLAASIDHPHIITVHAVGEHEGRAFIAMQWVDGGDLGSRLARGPLPVGEVLELGRQVAEALQSAHDRGLLHRDVKPANLLLRSGPRMHALLADFGVARDAKAAVQLTSTGAFIGTPLYSAPEQIAGTGSEPRSDVYALGCVLHACLTGSSPFGGADDDAQLRWAHLQAPRPHVRTTRPDAPQALDDLVFSTLAVEPDLRPASAGALAARLEELGAGRERGPAEVLVPTRAEDVAIAPAPPVHPPILAPVRQIHAQPPRQAPTMPDVPPQQQRSARRRPVALVLGLAAAVAAVAAVVAVVLLSGQTGDGRARTTDASTSAAGAPTSGRPVTSTPAGSTAPPTDSPGTTTAPAVAKARGVLATYVNAYANDDLQAISALLAPDVERYGRRADHTCGTTRGASAVRADYSFNLQQATTPYSLQGLRRPDAFRSLQDGAIETHGLTFALGSENPKPIRFVLREIGNKLKISSVRAYCRRV